VTDRSGISLPETTPIFKYRTFYFLVRIREAHVRREVQMGNFSHDSERSDWSLCCVS
jgi:hypothetical protein